MTTTTPDARRMCDAAIHLADVFDHHLAGNVATRFNCIETEALAGVMEAAGYADTRCRTCGGRRGAYGPCRAETAQA
jgi:hypothetical protein